MKNTIKQVFHSGKFLVGFVIFVFILIYIIIYPLVVATSPMEMIGNGNFFPPGTYISQQEAATTTDSYQLNVDTSASKLSAALGSEEISAMADWLEKFAGIDAADIDVSDTEALVQLWKENYDPSLSSSLKSAKRKYYKRLNDKITEAMKGGDVIIAEKNEDGELERKMKTESSKSPPPSEVSSLSMSARSAQREHSSSALTTLAATFSPSSSMRRRAL